MRHIIFIAVVTIFYSCGNKDDYNLLSKQFELLEVNLNEYKHIIIIPNEGCTGCISNTTHLVSKNIDQFDSVGVIFTSVRDSKMLRMQLGKPLFDKSNVFIDREGYLDIPKLKSIYPQSIKLTNGQITLVELFNPTNEMAPKDYF